MSDDNAIAGRRGTSRRAAAAWVAGVVAIGVLAGCRGEDPGTADVGGVSADAPAKLTRTAPLVLEALTVTDQTPPAVRAPRIPGEVEGILRAGFYGDDRFVREASGPQLPCQGAARVAYVLVKNRAPDPTAEVGDARVLVEAELKCDAGEKEKLTFRVSLDDSAAFGGDGQEDGPSTIERLMKALAGRAADVLHGQVRMREATDAEVLDALSTSTHEGILAEAASEAGERKLEAALPPLVKLTADGRDLVAIRAGAALGLLRSRDEDVIRALAHMTNGPNEEKHLVAINALGDIGGDSAVRYLRSIAEGHPNPALRDIARRAVARLTGDDPDAVVAPEEPPEDAPVELP